ncbi:hypothetical protein B0H16DRAFT_1384752 [Mycena metata]|uniref:DUF6534 domain-containing protein n=1 Tax=Mycena metata TaxID=1033252 RepID=A0AAD7HNH1_9AGAR|nr:hypothetical protein B0H16DRAFT_1384752 [Mycena metata]
MSGVILSRASLIPLDNFLGAWLIGLIVSSVFFGVTCLQVYLYFTKHSARDPVFLKTFVVLLLALDTLHLAFVSHSFYFATVTNFGDYVELGTAPWSLLVQMAVAVLLATCVQLFYAFRIYTLSNKSLVLPVMIGVLAFADLALAIATVHKTFQVKYFSLASEDLPYFAASLSIKVACDVLIASAMVYYLLRRKTGFHKTRNAINLLVTYSLRSGAITMMCAICHLATFVALPSTLIYAPFFFVLVRLYTLSFLSILNSRDHVREQLFSIAHAMITIPSSYTGDSSKLPADAETVMTGAEKGTGKVSGSVFSTTGEEGPGPHPSML